MIKVSLMLCLSFLLTGCFNLGERRESSTVVYYVLNDTAVPVQAPPIRVDAPTLLVLDTTTARFYDTDQLIFSRNEGTRGQYQFARWTERPGKRFAELMRTRLDQQRAWRVSAAGGYVRGDVLLDTELVEFYHDATNNPGVVRLELRAELVDLKTRTLLSRRHFKQDVLLTTYDAAGTAKASNQAVGRALDELTAWLATFR